MNEFDRVEEQRRRVVEEALLFLYNSKIPCSELDGWGLKAAIWAGVGEQEVHANLRWEENWNRRTGNGTIPLSVLRLALASASPPIVIVHWPSWGVVTPKELESALRQKATGTWWCCLDCVRLFKTGQPIPEHCSVLHSRKGSDDKPYFGFPLAMYKGGLDLYVLGDRERKKELVLSQPPSQNPLLRD